MKKAIVLGALVSILFAQCAEEKDPFLISNGSIGHLSKEIQIKQVDSIMSNDSIVPLAPIKDAMGTQGEVDIFEKGGNKLLRLSPEKENDPTSVITNIQVFDARYKTDKGLNVNSTWSDVKANYEIEGIQNAINSVVVILKDSDVFITIDKKELPENLRYNYSAAIEATQIPDTAKFKYFMVAWEIEETVEDDKTED